MKDNPLSKKGFLVWIICVLFFMYEFLLRVVVGTFQHPVMSDLQLSSFQFSLLSTTTFLIIYGVMQIPVGIIADHIGLKKSVLIGVIFCTISAVGLAYSYSFPVAVFFRTLMGFGASFGFICLLISVHDWMPNRRIAFFIGVSQFVATMGPMLAAGPLDTLASTTNVSWRSVFLSLSGVGVVLSFLVSLFVENNKEQMGRYIILHRPESIKISVKRLFSRAQPWYIAFFSAFVYFAVEYLSENEGRFFLGLKGFNLSFASYLLTISWLGYAVGCPLLGFLSDFLQRRKSLMAASALCAIVSILLILLTAQTYLLMLAFFLLGIGASGQSLGFATTAEQFKKHFVAIGFGLNNAIIILVSAITAPFIGWLLDISKGGLPANLNHYDMAFSVLVVFAGLAWLISAFFIKETYCKSSVDFTYLEVRRG